VKIQTLIDKRQKINAKFQRRSATDPANEVLFTSGTICSRFTRFTSVLDVTSCTQRRVPFRMPRHQSTNPFATQVTASAAATQQQRHSQQLTQLFGLRVNFCCDLNKLAVRFALPANGSANTTFCCRKYAARGEVVIGNPSPPARVLCKT
jgi:hypothetical protein